MPGIYKFALSDFNAISTSDARSFLINRSGMIIIFEVVRIFR